MSGLSAATWPGTCRQALNLSTLLDIFSMTSLKCIPTWYYRTTALACPAAGPDGIPAYATKGILLLT